MLNEFILLFRKFQVAQTVKRPPAMLVMQVRSLGWEDPLGEEMATHSSILAWRIPMDKRSLAGYSPWGRKESDTTNTFMPLFDCSQIPSTYIIL